MESPFYPSFQTNRFFSLYLETILDSYSQTYQQVITLSGMPSGPLASCIKIKSLPKLSPFVCKNEFSSGLECSYILMRYPIGNSNNQKCAEYMYSSDIPAVFSYLTNNGYSIDNSATKMMNQSRVLVGNGNDSCSDRRLICFASYST